MHRLQQHPSETMKVALLAPLFESVPPRFYGGTERVVANLCKGLQSRGIDVTLFATHDSTIDVKKISVSKEALRLRKKQVVDQVPHHLKMLATVGKHASEFDIIHNHHDYWMLPLSFITRHPLLTTLHGQLQIPDIAYAFESFENCAYVSISNSQRPPLSHLPWVSTIYHGIDVDQFQFYEDPGKYLAFLGRISPEKKPEWAIEIAKKSGVPLKIAAKIEGKAGQDYFDQVIKKEIDGKFIEYVGEISENEKSEFLGNALGLTFPIDWPEPFGLVVIESLACGTPVLARPMGSVPELLRDGFTGFCDLNIQTLAKKVSMLHRISRSQCRAWVEQRFSLHRMTEDYIHVYRSLIQHSSASFLTPSGQGIRPYRNRRNFLYSIERSLNRNP